MTSTTSDARKAVTGGKRSRRSFPIALYLFILVLVALVPAFIFSAILIERNNDAQERVVETLITGTSRSIVQAVEREILANITTLRVFAVNPELMAGDIGAFHALARRGLEGTGTHVFLLDSDLHSVMSTRVDYPQTPLPASDPDSAREALETGDVVVSDLVLGVVSNRYVYSLLVPVYPATGDPLVLGLTRDGEALASALLANKLPDGWSVALVDGKGQIIAGSAGPEVTGQPFTLLDPDALGAAPGWTMLDVEGQQAAATVQRSFLTGWHLVAWAPADVVKRPLSEAFWSLLIGGMLLAAAVVLVLYWVSLQIGRSVHRLEDDAELLGAGGTVPARDYPITEIANVSKSLSDASHRRRSAELEVRFLMRELAHRSKNQMTVIAAMAKQTAKGAESVPEFVQSFEKRIFGLARSTDLLLANGAAGVDLEELFTRQIEPFSPLDNGRVQLSGPPVRLNMQAAQIIGMAGHELATNAAKYGAFSRDDGVLRLAWSVENQTLHVIWREIVPNAAAPSERRGFGTTVLENMVGRALGADVRRVVHDDGIEWSFSIPEAALDPALDPQKIGAGEAGTTPVQPPTAGTGGEK